MMKMISYAVCAGAVLATSAWAQDPVYDDPATPRDPYTTPDRGAASDTTPRDSTRDTVADRDRSDRARDRDRVRDRDRPPSRVGIELQVGGGAEGFLDRDASSVAKTGGDWTARFVLGTRSIIGLEAAYLGSAHNLDTLGVGDRAALMSHGLEGALRLNILRGPVQPYAVAGYTWRRYTVTNTAANFSSVGPSDNVSAIPLGVGLAFRPGRFVIDIRATYHRTFGEELIPNANLSTLSGNAKLGFEF